MRYRLALALALTAVAATTSAHAQRPRIGFGIGGGTILGSRLLEEDFTGQLDGLDVSARREINLEDVAVLSANAEWYVVPNVAVRLHGAWGAGRLEVVTDAAFDGDEIEAAFESDFGDVRVSAYDAAVSIWPWAPGTTGFAPFVTLGIGRFTYDFDAATGDGPFRAEGRRRERAWILGFGADLHVWRSVTLRVEAMDHIVDSPFDASDFDAGGAPIGARALDGSVNNVRLTIGAHVYFPFHTQASPDGP